MLIPKAVFGIVKASAREPTRYAINGVHVFRRDGDCVAETTDGRILARARWSDDTHRDDFPAPSVGLSVEPVDDFSAIVSPSQWTDAGKLISKRTSKAVLLHALLDESDCNGAIKIGATDGSKAQTVSDASVEGCFPDADSVIPQYTPGVDAVEFCVNARFLGNIARILADAADIETVRIIVSALGSRTILLVADGDTVRADGVLMPVKFDAKKGGPIPYAPELQRLAERVEALDALASDSMDRIGELKRDARELLDKIDPDRDRLASVEPADDTEATAAPMGADGPEPVSVVLLRQDAERLAPVSGARCRACGANPNSGRFDNVTGWTIAKGSAYCPDCQASATEAGS